MKHLTAVADSTQFIISPLMVSFTWRIDIEDLRFMCLESLGHTDVDKTRMHSSRMRTARLLTVSRSIQWGGSAHPPPPRPPMQTPPFAGGNYETN